MFMATPQQAMSACATALEDLSKRDLARGEINVVYTIGGQMATAAITAEAAGVQVDSRFPIPDYLAKYVQASPPAPPLSGINIDHENEVVLDLRGTYSTTQAAREAAQVWIREMRANGQHDLKPRVAVLFEDAAGTPCVERVRT